MISRDDLKAYVDGELSPVQMAAIRDAIDSDPALAREVEEISSLTHTIRASVPMPEVKGLDETLNALRKRRNPMRNFGWPIAIVGACGVLFAIVFPVFSQAKSAAKSTDLAFMKARETDAVAATAAPVVVGQEEQDKAKSVFSTAAPHSVKAYSKAPAVGVPQNGKRRLQDSVGESEAALKKNSRVEVGAQPQPSLMQTPPRMEQQDGSVLALSAKVHRDLPETTALSEMPGGAVASVNDKPVVLVVDSLEDARKKVANLVGHFDGTVSSAPASLAAAASSSNELVVMVPASKAPEAIETIRTVVTAPSRYRESSVMTGAGRAPANSAQMDKSDVRYWGGRGGGAGGGGGGFGGGGFAAGGGAGGPGSSPAAPSGGAGPTGGSVRLGTSATSSNSANSNRQEDAKFKIEGYMGKRSSAEASKSVPPLAAVKKPAVPLRRIVIVLKKRIQKPNTNDHR